MTIYLFLNSVAAFGLVIPLYFIQREPTILETLRPGRGSPGTEN